MPWRVHYEPSPPKVKGRGKSADVGTLTATYTEADGAFTFVVTEKNFEPGDDSAARDFVARARGELALIKGTQERMDELLNAGEVPAA